MDRNPFVIGRDSERIRRRRDKSPEEGVDIAQESAIGEMDSHGGIIPGIPEVCQITGNPGNLRSKTALFPPKIY